MKNIDLYASVLLSIGFAVSIMLAPEWHSALRIVLALALVLIIPGYILSLLLLPKINDMAGIERLALSLGLSIAVISLIGLFLNYTPWGIRFNPIMVTLTAFVILSSAMAWLRRQSLKPIEKYHLPVEQPGFLISALTFMGILGFFVVLLSSGLSMRPTAQLTEFYILGQDGKLDQYPSSIALGKPFSLTVGVANFEHQPSHYIIVTRHNKRIIDAITLAHDQRVEGAYTFINDVPDSIRRRFILDLYRVDDVIFANADIGARFTTTTQPYRQVSLILLE